MTASPLLRAVGLAALTLAALAGCDKKDSHTTAPSKPATPSSTPSKAAPAPAPGANSKGAAPSAKKHIKIGGIAKSTSNPVFKAAETGFKEACADLSKKTGVEIEPVWNTPTNEDAQQQASKVEQLVSAGVDGIAISCTDGKVLQGPINDAVDKGVVVVTFDSDSPDSKRMAYYGINDAECGREVMRQLAKAMGDKPGPIAILSGSQTAPNLNARIQGVKAELDAQKSKGFTLKDTYYTVETADQAASRVQSLQTTNPDIAGWAMVGGWPLFTKNALDGIADKGVKVVSVDTLEPELDYVEKGQVQALIGQDCYGWGYHSVELLVDKIVNGKSPEKAINNFPLQIVTKDNVAQTRGTWQKWLGEKK